MEHDDDIEQLFKRIERHFENKEEGARHMLGMLVRVALSYRDKLVVANEPALTVGETQQALDAFMVVVKTHQFPEISDQRIKRLVLLWLEELQKTVHH
jgi:hypothetical protein